MSTHVRWSRLPRILVLLGAVLGCGSTPTAPAATQPDAARGSGGRGGGSGGTAGGTGGAAGSQGSGGLSGAAGGAGGDTGSDAGGMPEAPPDAGSADDGRQPSDGPLAGGGATQVPEPPVCERRLAVATLDAMRAAINEALPGDCILLADGTHPSDRPISIARAGTARAPITISAEKIGGATISGAAGFSLAAGAAHVTIRGFRFTHAGALHMSLGTSRCALVRNVFQMAAPGSYLFVQGLDHEIGYNSFQNKLHDGSMVRLDGPSRDHGGTQRAYFHHNHFLKLNATSANGSECVATWGGFTRFEHNLFEECNGDPEIISMKSSDGVLRHNTFRNSSRGQFTLRYANRTLVDGNFFLGTRGGMRVYGRDNTIINNYFQGTGGTAIAVGDGTAANTYLPIERMLIAHNTLVEESIAARSGEIPPRTLTIASNIILKSSGTAISPGPGWQATYQGNIIFGGGTPGIPAGGFRAVDPQLTADGHIAATSPAIDGASPSAAVTSDIDGHPRIGKPDIGADEHAPGPPRRPLTSSDVGPAAGM